MKEQVLQLPVTNILITAYEQQDNAKKPQGMWLQNKFSFLLKTNVFCLSLA